MGIINRKKSKMMKNFNELIVHDDPKSPISEKIRTLRTNILFSSVDEELQTILVTSPTPGDGKSWISANLAVAFAQTGSKVLLVDGDLRKGRQHKIFKLNNEFGFSNYLLEYGRKRRVSQPSEINQNISEGVQNTENTIASDINEDNIENESNQNIQFGGPEIKKVIKFHQTDIPNLTVMTSGSVPPNPSELLGSKKMLKIMEILKKKFDLIIFDGPPVNVVTDALILTRLIDTTVLVASVKNTQVKHLINAKKAVENVGGKIAGIVVNKIPVTNAKQYKEYYEYYQRKEDAKRVKVKKVRWKKTK